MKNIELKINPGVMCRMLNPLPMDFYKAFLGERKRAEAEHDRVVELTNRIKAKQIPQVKRMLKNRSMGGRRQDHCETRRR